MTEFSELLAGYVEEREVKVAELAQFCAQDRPTLYKFLNGKRLPATRELVERMADFLGLSPAKRQEFLEIYQIARVGKSTYFRQKSVREFLTRIPKPEDGECRSRRVWLFADPDAVKDGMAVTNEQELNQAASTLLLEECRKEDAAVFLVFQPECRFLMDFFIARAEEFANTRIEHIICMNSEGEREEKTVENLNSLAGILPLYVHMMEYQPYYYYDNADSHFYNLNILPCMIAVSSGVLLFHPEENRGILIRDRQTIAMMKRQFEEHKSCCKPFIQMTDDRAQEGKGLWECHKNLPSHVRLWVSGESILLLFENRKKELVCLQLKEPGLVLLFREFAESMEETGA